MISVDESVLKDIKEGLNIPPKPELLSRLQQELASGDPELNRVAKLISSDVATSAAVLKVINSPCYGLSRTITDIRQAVMFLGLDSITQLVTGFLLKQAFDEKKCCIKLERFWDTASEIADVATIIGQKVKSKVPVENLHLLGLFHDAGIPAMAMNYNDYVKVLGLANKDYDMTLVDHEEQHYRTNHAVIGFYLGSQWHLPKSMCELILRHHDHTFFDETIEPDMLLSMATLKMAENIVHSHKRFVAAPDWPYLKAKVLAVLELDEDDYQDIKEDAEDFLLHQ
ncbi:hypothetical protein PALB_4280 [Pseudoalteromonas luteoviolacea B = ATCC 29581]|nr:hypothetical protein PALB_4280 [Pseudoalteromonas luteoviolacea B = ATCC 29581]